MKDRLIQTIDIAIKPSLLLLGLLSVITILSCLIVITLPMPAWLKLGLITVIIVSTGYYTLRDALRLLPWSWQRLAVNSGGELILTNNSGQQFKPSLGATTFMHPLMVILNINNPTERTLFQQSLPPLLLFSNASDSMSEQHRQLRVWLRWWPHEKGGETVQYKS